MHSRAAYLYISDHPSGHQRTFTVTADEDGHFMVYRSSVRRNPGQSWDQRLAEDRAAITATLEQEWECDVVLLDGLVDLGEQPFHRKPSRPRDHLRLVTP